MDNYVYQYLLIGMLWGAYFAMGGEDRPLWGVFFAVIFTWPLALAVFVWYFLRELIDD